MGNRFLPGLKLDLLGMYQRKNLPAVLKSVEVLRECGWDISNIAVLEGLANTMELTRIKRTVANSGGQSDDSLRYSS